LRTSSNASITTSHCLRHWALRLLAAVIAFICEGLDHSWGFFIEWRLLLANTVSAGSRLMAAAIVACELLDPSWNSLRIVPRSKWRSRLLIIIAAAIVVREGLDQSRNFFRGEPRFARWRCIAAAVAVRERLDQSWNFFRDVPRFAKWRSLLLVIVAAAFAVAVRKRLDHSWHFFRNLQRLIK
jgi:hypothetical protein